MFTLKSWYNIILAIVWLAIRPSSLKLQRISSERSERRMVIIAQLVERLSVEEEVVGSKPTDHPKRLPCKIDTNSLYLYKFNIYITLFLI